MNRRAWVAVAAAIPTIAAGVFAWAGGFREVREFLVGYEEVPAISTNGSGQFRARVFADAGRVEYELSYGDTEGTVTQAHIHLGQQGVNGGISVFLCTNLGNGPAGRDGSQPCPPAPATVRGVIAAEDVSPNIPATQAARNQGLGTGEFAEFLDAMRNGALYVNVHSTSWPGGEIRSQIDPTGRDRRGP